MRRQDFPMFLRPETHEEYTLAAPGAKPPGYVGFSSTPTKDVTLRSRTWCAATWPSTRWRKMRTTDYRPFGGQRDLAAGICATFPGFAGPDRILRTARFAARYRFEIAEETIKLMRQMVENGEADAMVAERASAGVCRRFDGKNPRKMVGSVARMRRSSLAARKSMPLRRSQRADYHPEIGGIHTWWRAHAADMGLSLPEQLCRPAAGFGSQTPSDILPRHGHDLMVSNPCAKSISGCVRRNIAPRRLAGGLPLAH